MRDNIIGYSEVQDNMFRYSEVIIKSWRPSYLPLPTTGNFELIDYLKRLEGLDGWRGMIMNMKGEDNWGGFSPPPRVET